MRKLLLASLLFSGACSSAYADQRVASPQPPGPRTALAIAPEKVRAPYDVQIIREDGDVLPTYAFRGRYYVQGDANDRYIIHVTNPTPNRVEAVVTVDGLDVVDGEPGDLRKRGYIVPAYGDVRIEGFRTSLDNVATFRFSSVDGSYAGQKGKARNVGVIAVAIFEEQAEAQQQIVAHGPPPPPPPCYACYGRVDAPATNGPARAKHATASPTRTASADAPPPAPEPSVAPGAVGGAASAPAPRAYHGEDIEADDDAPSGGEGRVEEEPAPTHRPGLGTEFGEQRYSAASFTQFVRAANRPVAIAELRYNDTAGLIALGIPVEPLPDEGEIETRETADPFPGDQHFSRAP